MAALYPVLTIIYGSLQGYAAGDMLVCALGSGFMSGMVIYMHRANIPVSYTHLSVIYLHMIMPGQGARSRSPLFLKRRRTATRSG